MFRYSPLSNITPRNGSLMKTFFSPFLGVSFHKSHRPSHTHLKSFWITLKFPTTGKHAQTDPNDFLGKEKKYLQDFKLKSKCTLSTHSVDEEILRLQISMKNVSTMTESKAFQQLVHERL